MKLYRNAAGTVFAFEADGSQDEFIPADFTPITEAEAAELQAAQPSVPQEVSRFQAKAALALAGLLPQADAAVAASGNMVLQLAWTDATTFKRNSPGIAELAPALGLDDADLDQLFITAAGIIA